MTRRTRTPRQPGFAPVPVRPRSDGWTVVRQQGFVKALAQTGNVEAACKAVGRSTSSAYALRARGDAAAFREAWDIALDYAVHRVAEAALDRAINGTVTPVFFQGQQIGERRRYDETLTRFILRLRDPDRFGAWRDDRVPLRHPDEAALRFQMALAQIDMAGRDPKAAADLPPIVRGALATPEQAAALDHALVERLVERHRAEEASEASVAKLMEQLARIAAHRDAEKARAAHAEAAEPDLEGGTVCPVSPNPVGPDPGSSGRAPRVSF